MAGDPLKRVFPGSSAARLPAQAWNAFIEASRFVKDRQHNLGASSPYDNSRNEVIWIRNDTGENVERFGILGIGSPIISPETSLPEFLNKPVFIGEKPSASKHRGRFVVLAEPLTGGKGKNGKAAAGQLGQAFIYGVVPVKVNVATEEGETPDLSRVKFADVFRDNETGFLDAMLNGSAQVLWIDPNEIGADSGLGF